MYSILVSVRETCGDWARGIDPEADPALRGKKDTPDREYSVRITRRNVGKCFSIYFL